VPSLKNAAVISLEIFSIERCTVLVEPRMTSSPSSSAQHKIVNISKREKRYSKEENATPPHPEKPLKQAAIIFYFIGTLNISIKDTMDYSHKL